MTCPSARPIPARPHRQFRAAHAQTASSGSTRSANSVYSDVPRWERTHMQVLARARRLAEYICDDARLKLDLRPPAPHGHLGATLADAVLQAGLTYRTVVLPRVQQLKANWPT